jgi:hypothetical protein
LVCAWLLNEAGGSASYDLVRRRPISFGAVWDATSRGPSLRFDGTAAQHWAETPDDYPVLNGITQMSISVWIYRRGGVLYDGIINRSVPSGSAGFDIDLGGALGGVEDLFIRCGASVNEYGYTNDGSVPLNGWTHVCVVYNGTLTGNPAKLKLYVNGIQKTLVFQGATIATQMPTITRPIRLGRVEYSSGAANDYFNGFIDLPFIWTRALTPDEIRSLYEQPYQMVTSSAQRMAMYAASLPVSGTGGVGGIINNPIPM